MRVRRIATIVLAMCATVPVVRAQYTPFPAQIVRYQQGAAQTPGISANYSGQSGTDTLCYWAVANYSAGVSPVAGQCVSGIGTLGPTPGGGTNQVALNWVRPQGASSVDVFRTTATTFTGSCNSCLLLNNTVATSFVDDGSVVPGAYTLGTVIGAATIDTQIDNVNWGPPRLASTRAWTPQSLATGTPSASTYLRGDGTWQPISGITGGLADPGSNGVVVRTALGVTVARAITAGAGISVSNGDGVSGNPTISATGGAPVNATYIVQVPDATLTNEQALSLLATAPLKVTTGTGVVSSGAIDLGTVEVTGTLPVARYQGTYAAGQVVFGTGAGTAALTNLLAAVGGLMTNGRIPYVSGGALVDSANLLFNGTKLLTIGGTPVSTPTDTVIAMNVTGTYVPFYAETGGSERIRLVVANTPTLNLRQSTGNTLVVSASGQITASGNPITLRSSTTNLVTIGGSTTLNCLDETAVTGDSQCIAQNGAGQSSNPLQVRNNAGTQIWRVLPSGADRPVNSSTEPVNCTSAVYGATYFDTDDQRTCYCVNDGTDDEWVMSDDYTHATGHCSI